jgi:hypothetical protein
MKVAKVLNKLLNNYEGIMHLFEDIDNDEGPLEIYLIEPNILKLKDRGIIEQVIKTDKWSNYIGIYSIYPSDGIDRANINKYRYIIYNNITCEFLTRYFYTKQFYWHSLNMSGINK